MEKLSDICKDNKFAVMGGVAALTALSAAYAYSRASGSNNLRALEDPHFNTNQLSYSEEC
jgi:hypothetical protein